MTLKKKQQTVDTDIDLTPIDNQLDQEQRQKEEAAEANDHFELTLASRRDERNLAFYLLYAIDRSEYTLSLKDAIKNFEKGFDIQIGKNSFALKMVDGVLEKRPEFDQELKPHLKNWELERLGCCTRLILYLALWELGQAGAIPSVVINEAVEMAKIFAEKDAYRFINGVLDEIFKKREETIEK